MSRERDSVVFERETPFLMVDKSTLERIREITPPKLIGNTILLYLCMLEAGNHATDEELYDLCLQNMGMGWKDSETAMLCLEDTGMLTKWEE